MLVDLDGIYTGVAGAILVFLDGRGEGRHHLPHSPFDQMGKTDDHRRADPPLLETADHLVEIDRPVRPVIRHDGQMAIAADTEKSLAPFVDPVELG